MLINQSNIFLQNIIWRDYPDDTLRCMQLKTVTYCTSLTLINSSYLSVTYKEIQQKFLPPKSPHWGRICEKYKVLHYKGNRKHILKSYMSTMLFLF